MKNIISAIILILLSVILSIFCFKNRDIFTPNIFNKNFKINYFTGINIDSKNDIYIIADKYKKLIKFNINGEISYILEGGKQSPGHFYEIMDICFDEKDNFYLLNSVSDENFIIKKIQVLKYSPDGKYQNTILDLKYNNDKLYSLPITKIFISGNHLYYFERDKEAGIFSMFKKDLATNKVTKELFLSGEIFKESISEVDFKAPDQIAFATKKGNIYRIDKNKIRKVNLSNFKNINIVKPETVKIDKDNTLIIEDLFQKTVAKVSENISGETFVDIAKLNASGYKYKSFLPWDLDILDNGRLAVLDDINHCILILDNEGNLEKTIDKFYLSEKIMIFRFFVIFTCTLNVLLILFAVYFVYNRLLNKRVSIFIKMFLIFTPIVLISIVYISIQTYNAVYQKYEKEVKAKLLTIATFSQLVVDGDLFEKIQSPNDYMNESFQKILKQLKSTYNENNDEWNSELYATSYAVNKGVVYYAVTESEYTGAMFPYLYAQPVHLSAFEKGEIGTTIYSDFEGEWIIAAAPIKNSSGKIVGVFEVGLDMFALRLVSDKFKTDLFFNTLISLAIYLIVFSAFLYFMIYSIKALGTAIKKVENGDYNVNIKVRSRDEIGELSSGFNLMVKKSKQYTNTIIERENDLKSLNQNLEKIVEERTAELKKTIDQLKLTQDQLVMTEKLASVGKLAGGIAHELNSPLGAILTNTQLIKLEVDKERDLFDSILIIEQAAHKSKEIISYLLSYGSHLDTTSEEHILISRIINTSLVFIEKDIELHNIKITTDIMEDFTVKCNYLEMVQALKSIFLNSRDALIEKNNDKKEIWIKAYSADNISFLEIWDNGSGIKEENINKIFDPFFTTKKVGQGMGLGLSMTYDILKKNSAEIKVESKLGEFTKITIKYINY